MKAFRFSLQRLLELRENEVKAAESELERLRAQRAQLESERDALVASVERAAQAVTQQQYLQPSELVALDLYRQRVKREQQQYAEKLKAQDERIEKQKARVVVARGRVKLMEKLRERRRAEWQAAADRELDELTADFSAAQWLREQGR